MQTITAILRAKPGCADALRDALLAVADHVRAHEPETVDFFVSQDAADPHVLTTYERFVDEAARDRHNGSEAVARFFAVARPLLADDVTLVTSVEIGRKS